MNKTAKKIFEQAYQSYLYGGEIYCFKYKTSNINMINKYSEAVKYLEDKNLITVKFQNEEKVKLVLTDYGLEYGNLLY